MATAGHAVGRQVACNLWWHAASAGSLRAKKTMPLANVTLVWPFFVARGHYTFFLGTATLTHSIMSLVVSPIIVVRSSIVWFAMSVDAELHSSSWLKVTARVVDAWNAQTLNV
jgi:hypothetical protein